MRPLICPNCKCNLEIDLRECLKVVDGIIQTKYTATIQMEDAPRAMFLKDRNCVYLDCNDAFAKAAGLHSTMEIVGKTDYDLPWLPEQIAWFRECDMRIMNDDMPEYDIIEQQRDSNGILTWVKTNKAPLHDINGNVIGIIGTYEIICKGKDIKIYKQSPNTNTATI